MATGVVSREGSRLVADLMALPPPVRRQFLADLPRADRAVVFAAAKRDLGSMYGVWVDDPVGFLTMVVGYTLWSKQVEGLSSVATNQRTAIPACYGVGKTSVTGAGAVVWYVATRPVGTVKVATTAPKLEKVRTQLWPEIDRMRARANLPGVVDQAQWRLPTDSGRDYITAFGMAAPANREDAAQGIHAPHVMIVADEAGGIGGKPGESLNAAMTGANSRLLILGNPPLDEEGSWFEHVCAEADVNVVRIAWPDSPNATGTEHLPCRTCPPQMPEHSFATHLIDAAWVERVRRNYGEDSNYYRSKVLALWPEGGPSKTIPAAWVAAARERTLVVEPSTWVRLGVDVAADGGDEFAIGKWLGNAGRIVHRSSGAANANAVDVAGKVKEHIAIAEEEARALGSVRPVRVKVDVIGVGWGVVSILRKWREEGQFTAEIVGVSVGKAARDPKRFANQRAEMWWEFREELQPSPATGDPTIALDIDEHTSAQFAAPNYGHTSGGAIVIEKKSDIIGRGLPSPDRAEALILGRYEPEHVGPARVASASSARLPRVSPGARRGPSR
jgi:hypothetical protein